jgi:hydroxymethylglutaryl-CoA lyase
MPAEVQVCESWARDGLQSWPAVVPLEGKLAVLYAAAAAGVREVDATAFVPAKTTPQFGDADEVLAGLVGSGLRTRVLAPNLRGVQRAVEVHERLGGAIDTIGIPISASEAHNLANLRRTHADHFPVIEDMIRVAHGAGVRVIVAVATAYGCPIAGQIDESTVFGLAARLVDLGVDRMMLSDTTGLADPVRAGAYTARARAEFPVVEQIAHFHATRGTGLANTWAAVQAGATCVDSCLGGIGGEPATVEQNHAGETGNTTTEDLVVLLERVGVKTGIDIDRLLEAGRVAERTLGVPGRSQVQCTGPGLDRPTGPSEREETTA